jgi:peptide chain release factor 3
MPFLPKKKEIVDISYPGDCILYDTGNFKIGDTLTEGEITAFKGILSSEHFRYINNADPMSQAA